MKETNSKNQTRFSVRIKIRRSRSGDVGKFYAVGGVEAAGGAAAAGVVPGVVSFTRSFNSLLGLKKGIFLAGTSTRSPVLGLRPMRGLRGRVRKLATPRFRL